MQVNQVQDHVSHAILGGDESIAFGMSDSAEFFAILYKTLYSDQILAVVRETMCNGWDAHIENGCTDVPLDITLDPKTNELIIRDYGKGIPRKLIGPIYGVMGGSTKVENGLVTGGFGLGCKAPFAYGDHFGVTSWSAEDGLMTVYSMSKSNAEKKGKPGITPIVSIPITTGDHGIEVKIQIKPHDRHRFLELIARIAANGEMLVNLNGKRLAMLPFGEAKQGFFVTREKVIDTHQSLLLRYGNVIYPIDRAGDYLKEYEKIQSRINMLSNGSYNNRQDWKIVFQAPPNTISVTPSRETLSMQEHTIATIKGLFQKFLGLLEAKMDNEVEDILRHQIEYLANKGSFKELLKFDKSIPGLSTDPYNKALNETNLTDVRSFSQKFISTNYPNSTEFWEKDVSYRLNALCQAENINRELVKSFRTAVERPVAEVGPNYPISDWFNSKIVKPLLTDLKADPELSEEKIFIYGRTTSDRWSSLNGLVPLTKVPNRPSVLSYVGFIRHTVILAFNRGDVIERTPYFPYVRDTHGHIEDTLVYVVSRSPKKVKLAKEFFQKRGYMILDLTEAQPWEDQEAAAPEERVTPRAKRKGLPALSSVFTPGAHGVGGSIDTAKAQELDCKTIDDPKFVIKISAKNSLSHLPDLTYETSLQILRRWGDQGGVVINVYQEDKYLGMGAATFKDFVLTKVRDQYRDNPRIRASIAFDPTRSETVYPKYGGNEQIKILLQAIYAEADLSEYLGITWNMNQDDKVYVKMWEEFRHNGYVGSKDLGLESEIINLIKAIPLDPAVDQLFFKLKKAPMVELFKATEVRTVLKSTPKTEVEMKRRILCRDMLLQAIEG